MTKPFAYIAFIALLALTACGMQTFSSGVQEIGPDTYTVSADDLMASKAKGAAYSQASAYCAQSGRKILVIGNASEERGPHNVADVTFRCLGKGDRELRRPRYEDQPDLVIENRQ